MGLCHENQGALSPLLPGSRMESCPAQSGPCQLAPTPATPPPPGELQTLPASARRSPQPGRRLPRVKGHCYVPSPTSGSRQANPLPWVKGKCYRPPRDCWPL